MQVQPTATRDLRALKALVGGMGVLIVLGTALVIGVIIHRIYARTQAPSTAAVAPLPGAPVGAPLVLPRGSRIAGLAAGPGGFAVWVTGPGGDALWLVDPRTGPPRVVLTAPR